MDFTLLDPRLKEDLLTAINGKITILYRPECVFLKPDAELEIKAPVTSIIIVQDFVDTYQDTVQIEVRLNIDEYRAIQANIQDLECTLTLYPQYAESGTDNYDEDPIILEYVVFVQDQVDLDKQVQSNFAGDNKEDGVVLSQSQANTFAEYRFHLLSKTMRDMRKVQLNMISRETNIETVLHWACQNFGAESTVIIPPDNTSSITNFIIPPMHNLSTLFPYLQQRYGIYSKGMGYYYTGEVLYIYPLYDTSEKTTPIKDSVIYLINGVKTHFAMADVRAARVDNDLYIALTSTVKVAPMDTASAENKGDNLVSFNADNVLDRLAPVGGDGKVNINPNYTVIQRQNTATNMNSVSQSVTYKDITSNIYQSTSALAKDDGSKMETVWANAIPYSLYPGQNVVYNYSSADGNYESSKGRLMGVVYVSRPVSMDAVHLSFVFHAAMTVFLEPEKKSGESYQYN